MSLLDQAPIARRIMVLFFLVDTSGSMVGNKIGAVNSAIRELFPILDDISSNNADAEIKIALLRFSSGTEWLYNEPKPAQDVANSFIDFEAAGLTDLGEACLELNSKLSRNAYMQSTSGSFAPVIILLSDGGPTDNFHGGISKLKENRWFKSGIKIAIAIGQETDKDILKEFTGNIEAVFEVSDIKSFKTVIRAVTVTSSQIGSQSSQVGEKDKQAQVIEAVKEEIKEIEGAQWAADPNPVAVDDDWD